jgi:polysaccharide export outer membrane protein
MSSQSPESNALFNSGLVLAGSNNRNADPGSTLIGSSTIEGYLVDKNGYVSFPFIGRIKLDELTKEEATEKVTSILKKYVKDPIINIRITNFKVTVIGEVNRPATLIVPGEKINILEALANAGDMTPFGKRDNVVIIRDQNNIRSTARVNLNKKSLLNSPYFYLQQNDIVYVEPNKAKGLQSSASTYNLPMWFSLASLVAFVISSFR